MEMIQIKLFVLLHFIRAAFLRTLRATRRLWIIILSALFLGYAICTGGLESGDLKTIGIALATTLLVEHVKGLKDAATRHRRKR